MLLVLEFANSLLLDLYYDSELFALHLQEVHFLGILEQLFFHFGKLSFLFLKKFVLVLDCLGFLCRLGLEFLVKVF